MAKSTVHELNITEYELTGQQDLIEEYKVRIDMVYIDKHGDSKTKNSIEKWPKILDELTQEQRDKLALEQIISAVRLIEEID